MEISKAPTGIRGLDQLTGGGLPAGRPTLVCGGPGCGKTFLATEFLVRGAREYDEPGVFMSFEERIEDLDQNYAALGFDLAELRERRLLAMDHVHLERSEIELTGEFDLEGLFVRLDYAIRQVGARRVVLDTIEALFAGLPEEGIIRAELRRLFGWLKDRGMTAIVTGERGDGSLTRHGIEEYISDCVILLDHRVHEHISTRRLRIVKYRGSAHGANEYPFVIDQHGLFVMPVTSARLDHPAPDERIPTGVSGLDELLGGEGFYRGSNILISGEAGTGKTSIASTIVNAACAREERCLVFKFEESPQQVLRNMRSIGIDLRRWREQDLLQIHATRPAWHGLEQHLALMINAVEDFRPSLVVVDPISALGGAGRAADAHIMLLKLTDYLKSAGITSVLTHLTHSGENDSLGEISISSLVDTWIALRSAGPDERNVRRLSILKSRGMANSREWVEYQLTDNGVRIVTSRSA